MSITAERIKALRKQKGLTQQELADSIKVSRDTITKYENARSTPTLGTLSLIADALDTSVAYLQGDTNNVLKTLENTPDFIELTDDDVVMLYAGKKVTEANKKAILAFARMLHEEDVEL